MKHEASLTEKIKPKAARPLPRAYGDNHGVLSPMAVASYIVTHRDNLSLFNHPPDGTSRGQVTYRSESPEHPPHHHKALPGTWEEAAKTATPKVGRRRKQVLDFIESRGMAGCTDDEDEVALGLGTSPYTPRRGELVQGGLVVGTKKRQHTLAGRPAAVCVAVEFAQVLEGEL